MVKKKIITMAGSLGSGKSTTAKKVAEMLSYDHYSTGDFMRSIANEKGISLVELGFVAEGDSSIDKILDDKNVEIGQKENIVLDSRLGFHFIPESFKVFLEVDIDTASKRILEDKKHNLNRHTESNEEFDTVESITKQLRRRSESEKKRYKDLYNIEDQTAHGNFDLVINTAEKSVEEVGNLIINQYNKWLE